MARQTTYDTDPAAAFAGLIAEAGAFLNGDVRGMYNAEASAKIPFGRAVKWGSTTDNRAAKLPAADSDKIVGIVAHSHAYENDATFGELDPSTTTGGVRAGGKLSVLRRGVIWVVAEDAVVPGDRLWVRAVAGGDPEFLGGCTNADDGSDTIDCTGQGEWLDAADAGELARLSVDFTNHS